LKALLAANIKSMQEEEAIHLPEVSAEWG